MTSFRSQIGVDKSVDNFKLGFKSGFGGQLGMSKLGQSHAGPIGQASFGGGAAGAVQQPNPSFAEALKDVNPLDNSMRGSNILSTPSSKAGRDRDDDEDKQ